MTSRPSTAAPILAVLAVVLATLGVVYVGGYVSLGKVVRRISINSETAAIVRLFPHEWQAQLFQPARTAESFAFAIEVRLTSGPTYPLIEHPIAPIVIQDEDESTLGLESCQVSVGP